MVCWLLEQTIQGLENLQPLYYAQGMNYCRRAQAQADFPEFVSNEDQRHAFLNIVLDPEQQTLKSLYEPRSEKGSKKRTVHLQSFDGKVATFYKELERHRRVFQDTGSAVQASALQEVEQEREVAVEAETIRERQTPILFHPQDFSGLNDDIREFVKTGNLRTGTLVCEQVFSYLRTTSTGQKYPVDLPTSSRLYVTLEFRKTVFIPSGKPNDEFMVGGLQPQCMQEWY